MRYLGVLCLMLIASATYAAKAQDNAVLERGEAVVTCCSGTKPADPPASAADPLGEAFIDRDDASAQILRLEPGVPPARQLISAAPVFRVEARDVGQVFLAAARSTRHQPSRSTREFDREAPLLRSK